MLLLLVTVLLVPAISVGVTLTVVELIKATPPVAKKRRRGRRRKR